MIDSGILPSIASRIAQALHITLGFAESSLNSLLVGVANQLCNEPGSSSGCFRPYPFLRRDKPAKFRGGQTQGDMLPPTKYFSCFQLSFYFNPLASCQFELHPTLGAAIAIQNLSHAGPPSLFPHAAAAGTSAAAATMLAACLPACCCSIHCCSHSLLCRCCR